MCHKQMMSDVTSKAKCPRSPFRRNRIIREPIRPRLSRKIITTPRVNLNSYWSKFEELSNENIPVVSQSPSTRPTYEGNEINDNLVNELAELCRK